MDSAVPPEIECALVEEARRLRTAPESLAVDSLQERFTSFGSEEQLITEQSTLVDFLSEHIGILYAVWLYLERATPV